MQKIAKTASYCENIHDHDLTALPWYLVPGTHGTLFAWKRWPHEPLFVVTTNGKK